MIYFPINLANLRRPRDVCDYMTGRKFYTYGIFYNSVCVKYGMSHDNEWPETWGNRIYRQAGGIPGWINMLHDTSAKITTDLFYQFLPHAHKNDIIFIVNDYTQDIVTDYQKEITTFLLNRENELVKEHEKTYGEKPILNKEDTKEIISAYRAFNNLFEVNDD